MLKNKIKGKKATTKKNSKLKIKIKIMRIKIKINKLEGNHKFFLLEGKIEKKNNFNKITIKPKE